MYNRPRQRKNGTWRYAVSIIFIFILIFVITAFASEPIEDVNEAKVTDTTETETEVIQATEETIIIIETKPDKFETKIEENTDLISTESNENQTIAETEVTTEAEVTEAQAKIEVPALSEEDRNILLKIVEAEATGQAVEGKMYVAAVILNRVKSSDFPDSVKKVVYQGGQFSPVSDGRINCKPTETTIEAVNRVLAGETDAQGATFFMNPKISSKKNVKWFRSHLSYLFSYGGHEFYK